MAIWKDILTNIDNYYLEVESYIDELRNNNELRNQFSDINLKCDELLLNLNNIYDTLVRHFMYREGSLIFDNIKLLNKNTIMFTKYQNEEMAQWQL